MYYYWRRLNPAHLDDRTRAVRLLYLNRNCFNGIYRTNRLGEFNVPMGSKLGSYFSIDDIIRCSQALQGARLVHGDFEDTLRGVRANDFVYLDPPYAVTSRRVFREYGREIFNPSDLDRFSKQLKRIDAAGADFLVSYADCTEARALAKVWKSERVPVRRHIAGFADARRQAYEWLITNIQSFHEPAGPSS